MVKKMPDQPGQRGLLSRLAFSGELIVVILMVIILAMLFIPLPPFLLDLFFSVNIALSFLILMLTMNVRTSLEFSVFPTILLLTTLFRLALNVSSTRLILLQGYAGQVVEAFGNFVAGSNPVVGFIIFLILTLINFLVITKGSERVAEVAARFTLDAMPGKQMSIDGDLNAGLITEEEARERRRKIEREADFYGAMDGASKFIKGDAIAGIVIVFINIIGGIVMGTLVHDFSVPEALERYAILTLGDGLVSQIPALLISTAMGMVVTRAAAEDNLASDLSVQLLRFPKMLYIVAGTLVALGLFTPIGPVIAVPIAGVLAYGGYRLQKYQETKQAESRQMAEETQIEEVRSPESVVSLLNVDPIEFEFGYGLIPLADTGQGGDLLDRIIMIRRQCALEMGIIVPVIRISDYIQLKPNEYVIKIKGNTD